MYTIVETHEFIEAAEKVWRDDERLAFISFIANNPLAGDVIVATGGFRKVRWSAGGKGKRGGVRVIYYNLLDDGQIVLFTVYAKSKQANISPKQLTK